MIRSSYVIGVAFLIPLAALACLSCGDDDKGTDSKNQPPVIISMVADSDTIIQYQKTSITVTAEDPDDDPLDYTWTATWPLDLPLSPSSPHVREVTTCGCQLSEPTAGTVGVTVEDGRGGEIRSSLQIWVVPAGQQQ